MVLDKYTVHLSLNKAETVVFEELLAKSDLKTKTFLIMAYKELKRDLNSLLRLIDVGIKEAVMGKGIKQELTRLIKESIILANYKTYLREGNEINIKQIVKSDRFKFANISRRYFAEVLNKYDIETNRPTAYKVL